MQSFIDFDFNRFNSDHERPTSAYVRRRLAEATLSQDEHDGSSWRQLDPGPPDVRSASERAQTLHDGLLGSALQHVDMYMNRDTNDLAIGELLEAQLEMDDRASLRSTEPLLQDGVGYMDRPSVFQMVDEAAEMVVEEQSVEQMASRPSQLRPKHKPTITYYSDDHKLKTLQDVNLKAVIKRSPLLAMAFEDSRSGPQLFLETLSSQTAEPFLRFLNTGSYAEPSEEWNSGGRYEDVPTSVLFHCQMYRLGDIYDLADMKSQAYVNVLRQGEFGCSSPDKPIDLCAAIRFVYTHLAKEEQLIDAIINYCVACFLRHRLAEDAEFRQLAYDLRPFHQDLCKNCMNRGFENETASAIIQMPFEPHQPETYASSEDRRSMHDVVFHFHSLDEPDAPKKRKRVEMDVALPIRPATNADAQAKTEADSEKSMVYSLESKRRHTSELESGSQPVPIKEEEFEEVDLGPAPGKAADSDDESFEWVDVLPEHLKDPSNTIATTSVPLRPKERAGVEKAERNESDSDWSLV